MMHLDCMCEETMYQRNLTNFHARTSLLIICCLPYQWPLEVFQLKPVPWKVILIFQVATNDLKQIVFPIAIKSSSVNGHGALVSLDPCNKKTKFRNEMNTQIQQIE